MPTAVAFVQYLECMGLVVVCVHACGVSGMFVPVITVMFVGVKPCVDCGVVWCGVCADMPRAITPMAIACMFHAQF